MAICYSFIAAEQHDLLQLADPQHRSQVQVCLCLESLGELNQLISSFGTGLTIGPQVNIPDVKEIWSVSGALNSVSHDNFEGFYQQWLETSERPNNDNEYQQLQALNDFLPAFNNAAYSLIVVEPIEENPQLH